MPGQLPLVVAVAEIRQRRFFTCDPVLATHALPVGEDSPLLTDDFVSFLEWRQERIWLEIQRVTGAVSAADLEADEEPEESPPV